MRGPGGTAEQYFRIDRPIMPAQRFADGFADLGDVAAWVVQFVDAVDEDDHITRPQGRDHADHRQIDRCQSLRRGQHDDAKPAAAQRVDGDLLADHEGVVHPRRVLDAKSDRQSGLLQPEISGPSDVRKAAAFPVAPGDFPEVIAHADIPFDKGRVEPVVVMRLTKQHLEPPPEPFAGLGAHLVKLRAHLGDLISRPRPAGELSQPTALAYEMGPFLFGEEGEDRIAGPALGPRLHVQRGDDRGPGVHVCGQKVVPAGQGVDQRRLPGLDLADHGDARLEAADPSAQLPGL